MPRQMAEILNDLSAMLLSNGVDAYRIATSVPALHPEVFARNVVWNRDGGTVIVVREHTILTTAPFIDSPVAKILAGHPAIRCRLTGPNADLAYEICRELVAEGATDYFILPVPVLDAGFTYLSFASDSVEGFSSEQLVMMSAVVPSFERELEREYMQYALRSLMEVYLGSNASQRVLAGAFKRGTGETVHAAIWSCDLRGFTTLADTRQASDVVKVLDQYFDAVGGPIERHGGEILKFIGDAVLAVFPFGNDPTDACRRALLAAEQAIDALADVSCALVANGGPALALGVGLHTGEVFYGNIGAHRRLDFTVIGSAVNEVCRVESLCKSLHTPLLVTDVFRQHVSMQSLHSLGHHALRGAALSRELFTLPRFRK
jgi:adenylate cyclase